MKFSIKDLFSNCDQIHRKLQIWSHLPKKILNLKRHILCSENVLCVMLYLRLSGNVDTININTN